MCGEEKELVDIATFQQSEYFPFSFHGKEFHKHFHICQDCINEELEEKKW